MDDIAAIVTVHLEEPLPADALPAGARVGVGPPVTGAGIARSWAGARYALRFTGPDPADRVVEYAGLGALALFAHVPVEAIAELADVQALEKLARMPNGAEALAAVRALCAEGSVRRAAAAVHLHHSSMAGRIARAEAVLGYSLADPAGRLRAHLALALVRLRANVSEAAPGATPPRARPRPGD
jgi:sugar diacid utilization regulator